MRGKDLNLRPLGYEFNTWFWLDSVIAKNQSHTVSIYLMVSTVSGSPVSNFGLQPTRLNPTIAERPVVAKLLSSSSNGKPTFWSDTAYPPRMSTFHISHILPQPPHLTPILSFRERPRQRRPGICRQHKPRGGRGSAASRAEPHSKSFSSWRRSIWVRLGLCQKQ